MSAIPYGFEPNTPEQTERLQRIATAAAVAGGSDVYALAVLVVDKELRITTAISSTPGDELARAFAVLRKHGAEMLHSAMDRMASEILDGDRTNIHRVRLP